MIVDIRDLRLRAQEYFLSTQLVLEVCVSGLY